MSASAEVIAGLREAKQKLTNAQQKGFQGVVMMGKLENLVAAAVGRTDGGRRLLEEMSSRRAAMKAEVTKINLLVKDIDKAIAELNHAGAGSTPAPGPDPGPARPAP